MIISTSDKIINDYNNLLYLNTEDDRVLCEL